jgi:hypothetical protein
VVLEADAKATPGLRGNLIIEVSGERKPPTVEGRPRANVQRVPLGVLPAIPFEIVGSGALPQRP